MQQRRMDRLLLRSVLLAFLLGRRLPRIRRSGVLDVPHSVRVVPTGRTGKGPSESGASESGMDQDAIAHLERLGELCTALARHPSLCHEAPEASFDRLSAFDQDFWTFTRYLSLPVYQETCQLLQELTLNRADPPRIAVVMPIYRPDPVLLPLSIRSAIGQVGVRVHLHLSLDGPEGNLPLVQRVLAELAIPADQVSLHIQAENRGVALCRNAALAKLEEEWFSFLDCDDLFHPLRLLHAWLAMQSLSIHWLSTACSRVSIAQRKIVLLQQSIVATGMNSFLAHRIVLEKYGYLAPLRFWEDTEYQQRLAHFQEPMLACSAVAHYANTELTPGYSTLGSRWRREAYPIEGHPYLCGSVIGDLDPETYAIRDHYRALHASLKVEDLPRIFPAQGSEAGLPPRPGQG